MDYIEVKIPLFEVGSYVRTWDGVGIVRKCEFELDSNGLFRNMFVTVQHKSGLSSNPSNKEKDFEFTSCFKITKEEYDNDE